MKTKISAVIFCFVCYWQLGVAQNFSFSYDATGNRTNRTIVLNKSTAMQSSTQSDTIGSEKLIFSEELEDLSIVLFPNPTRDILFVDIDNLQSGLEPRILVFDISGRLMYTIETAQKHNVIEFSGFPPGNYVVKIFYGNNTTDWKVVNE